MLVKQMNEWMKKMPAFWLWLWIFFPEEVGLSLHRLHCAEENVGKLWVGKNVVFKYSLRIFTVHFGDNDGQNVVLDLRKLTLSPSDLLSFRVCIWTRQLLYTLTLETCCSKQVVLNLDWTLESLREIFRFSMHPRLITSELLGVRSKHQLIVNFPK